MRLTDGNPMTKTLMLTLIFEVVVYVLAIPGMIQVDDVPLLPAFVTGIGAALLAGVAAGTLRRPIGWVMAWAAQLACVALGFAVAMMFAVGAMFFVLFLISFILGRRLEATRTAG